jgi:hypothetical protein
MNYSIIHFQMLPCFKKISSFIQDKEELFLKPVLFFYLKMAFYIITTVFNS